MPKRKTEEVQKTEEVSRVAKGQDAIVTVEVLTAQGSESRSYRVPGFTGNTLAWQRTGSGLDSIIIKALQDAFGGQVTPA